MPRKKESVEFEGYTFTRSTDRGKKYDAFKDGKKIASFGGRHYEHYRDRIGLYSHLDHGNKERRKRFYDRHGTMPRKESALWFSSKFLW